jgi:hypothetical protein
MGDLHEKMTPLQTGVRFLSPKKINAAKLQGNSRGELPAFHNHRTSATILIAAKEYRAGRGP